MGIMEQILLAISGADLLPGFAGAVAGLYFQADEYRRITLLRAVTVFVASFATSHFVGNAACSYFGSGPEACPAIKFVVAAYTPDLMVAWRLVVEHYKQNPLDILKKLKTGKHNEKGNPDG